MTQRRLLGEPTDSGKAAAIRLIVFVEESVQQRRNVLRALAERRNHNRDDVDPIEEVLAESTFADARLKIGVGCADDPGAESDRRLAADAVKLALFEQAQELCLESRSEIADLVQKKRALAGSFGIAEVTRLRTGERAAFVTENFGLEQVRGNGRAVHGHERTG